MTTLEARYYRATRGCHRAWVETQPQYVIPGVLEAADAGAVRCFEPVASNTAGRGGLAAGGGVTAEIPLWADPSPLTHNGPDATLSEAARRGRKEATP